MGKRRPRSLLAVCGHRIHVAIELTSGRASVETLTLTTPAGRPLPVAAVETPAAIRLLRRQLRGLLGRSRVIGFTLDQVTQAGLVLWVPRHAEPRLDLLLAVLREKGSSEEFCHSACRIGETARSGIHREMLYPSREIEPVYGALATALGKELPFLDLQFGLSQLLGTDGIAHWQSPDGVTNVGAVRLDGRHVHGGYLTSVREELLGLADEACADLDWAGPPPKQVVELTGGWEMPLGGLLQAHGEGGVPAIHPALRAARQRTRRRHRARLWLVAATLLAVFASIFVAQRARDVLQINRNRLHDRQEALASGSTELRGGVLLVDQLARQQAELAARVDGSPALGTLLELSRQLPPDVHVRSLVVEPSRGQRLMTRRFRARLRAHFDKLLPAERLATRLSALVGRIGTAPGVTQCRLTRTPGRGDPLFEIEFLYEERKAMAR